MPPKGKIGGPNIAALREMMAAKQAAEAEAKRLEEEERRRLEEEERLEKELLAAEEASKLEKKERERLRREELRRQGKLLTKVEKDRQLRNKLKLEQILSSFNVQIPTTNANADGEVGKKKKPIYEKKKKVIHQSNSSEADKKKELEGNGDGDNVLDDWEAALDSDEGEQRPNVNVATAGSESKEDWGESSGSEGEATKLVADLNNKVSELSVASNQAAKAATSRKKGEKELRSPICVILGHVDTGKTKLLDKIRQTNVQEGEAGGITQQIGATYFPLEAIKEKTDFIPKDHDFSFQIPGLLIIDTPGHESFTNLRSRGSSLCNIAILVVDIMHGLEPQTLESIGLLRQRKTPFVVALNKVDRLYGWDTIPNVSFEEMLSRQKESVKKEFETRLSQTQLAFAEQGLNAELFFRNSDMRKYVSLVPTSALTGDGVADMLMLLVQLTQKMMAESLLYITTLQCTVLEVKVIEGLGTTIDVILSNGVLREGDRVVVCGLNGPIATNIRALLTPQPMKELRIKGQYVHHKMIKAAMGVKICAPDLEKAIAGSALLVIGDDDDEEEVKEQVMSDLTALLESVDKTGHGVCVQASTLGSLEALLSFLKDSKIPVSGINIGPIHKKDVVRASVMLEQAKEFAVILAFDVKIDKDAQELADEMDVRIFKADIIYHLFDQFTAYMNNLVEQKKKDMAPQAVFPCVLRIIPGCVFNKREPIILGVDVVDGVLRVGTPVCVPAQGNIGLGRVTSIEVNHKPVTEVRRGGPSVAIKIEHASYEPARMHGRHFFDKDEIVSKINRSSIDILKENFRNEMTKEDWALVVKLKKVLNIQ